MFSFRPGHVAGVYARTDNERGVHKAPANEIVRGALGLRYQISRGEQDILNLRGHQLHPSDAGQRNPYLGRSHAVFGPVVALHQRPPSVHHGEPSIERATQWVVFRAERLPPVEACDADDCKLPHLGVAPGRT